MDYRVPGLAVGLLVCMTGCVPPGLRDQTLPPVAYAGSVAAVSRRTAAIHLYTGKVSGTSPSTTLPVGGAYVPLTGWHLEKFDFGVADERSFADSLRADLLRLHMFSDVRLHASGASRDAGPAADGEVQIILQFVSTEADKAYYTLNVALHVGGAGALDRSYHIEGSEGDTTWQKMNTNNVEGKTKAATKLINKIIPDIESWIQANDGPAAQ